MNSEAVAPVEGRTLLPSGVKAYTCTWPAASASNRQDACPCVVLVHCFGEHCRRYDRLAGALAIAGFTVKALDLKGHGRTGGARGDLGALEEALADVRAFYEAAVGERGGGDGFLLGHSMGGVLVAAWAASGSCPARGIVMSAPAVHVAMLPSYKARLARVLGRVVPRAPVARVDPKTISSQREEQVLYASDPLVCPRTPLRAALTMYDAGALALSGAGAVRLPALIVHGSDDTLVPPAASERLHAVLASADKGFVKFDGCRHEVHHDQRRDEMAETITRWLASHC